MSADASDPGNPHPETVSEGESAPDPALEDLVGPGLAGASFGALDDLAGEVTERLLDRAEAYWKARTNEIFVRNHPELVQQLAQVDAVNLQTVVLSHQLAKLREALGKGG